MTWADKCDLLLRNPVTAARMFDDRLLLFFEGCYCGGGRVRHSAAGGGEVWGWLMRAVAGELIDTASARCLINSVV